MRKALSMIDQQSEPRTNEYRLQVAPIKKPGQLAGLLNILDAQGGIRAEVDGTADIRTSQVGHQNFRVYDW